MALPFRIDLKEGCTKNVCVHLCSNSEVAKTKQQDDTMISKNSSNVAGASKITYTLLWQFFKETNSRRTYITYYCTLPLFRAILK